VVRGTASGVKWDQRTPGTCWCSSAAAAANGGGACHRVEAGRAQPQRRGGRGGRRWHILRSGTEKKTRLSNKKFSPWRRSSREGGGGGGLAIAAWYSASHRRSPAGSGSQQGGNFTPSSPRCDSEGACAHLHVIRVLDGAGFGVGFQKESKRLARTQGTLSAHNAIAG
jgi:hypothetical protein